MKRILTRFALLAFLFTIASPALFAQLDWYADPDRPWRELFDNFNREDAGGTTPTITAVNDNSNGKVWKINKPTGAKRAELRGAKNWEQRVGETYFIGWRWKANIRQDVRPGVGMTVFQWKSYGDTQTQNYPFSMGYDGRNLTLSTYDPCYPTWNSPGCGSRSSARTQVWRGAAPQNQWVDIVLVVRLSRDPRFGYVEVWFNGTKQGLLTGGDRRYCKTMDGNETAPKWGVYNESSRPYDATVYLDELRLGQSLASVNPTPSGGGGGGSGGGGSSERTVYTDGFQDDWVDRSWGGRAFPNDGLARIGSEAFKYIFDRNGAVSFRNQTGKTGDDLAAIEFYARTWTGNAAVDVSGSYSVDFKDRSPARRITVTPTYQKFRITKAELGDYGWYRRFFLQQARAGVSLFIDDFKLVYANGVTARADVSGFTDTEASPALTVWPNPSAGAISLLVSGARAADATAILTDRIGRTVDVRALSLGATGEVPVQLDYTGTIAAGIYALRVVGADGSSLAPPARVIIQ